MSAVAFVRGDENGVCGSALKLKDVERPTVPRSEYSALVDTAGLIGSLLFLSGSRDVADCR